MKTYILGLITAALLLLLINAAVKNEQKITIEEACQVSKYAYEFMAKNKISEYRDVYMHAVEMAVRIYLEDKK